MIRVESHGALVSIALARPEKRNALTPEMLGSLETALAGIPDDARAVVLSGDGRMFCAGFDLKACAADTSGDTMRALLTGLSRCIRAMRALPQPVVGAIHGGAIAGGCALLGGMDIVAADRAATLGYPVVKIGVSPAVSAPFLTGAIPDGPARALLLDPGLIDAPRAHALGLVHALVDGPGAAREHANAIARDLAAKPVGGLRATKDLLSTLASDRTGHADGALEVSLGRAGSDEERAMLGALWAPEE